MCGEIQENKTKLIQTQSLTENFLTQSILIEVD